MELVRPAIQAALDEIIRDRIQDKLSITFGGESPKQQKAPPADEVKEETNGIETTDEEIEAFMIVRAIGARFVPVDRIAIRDAKSYCAVLMDNNNRKPVCRFFFNSAKTKSVVVFNAEKQEVRHHVEHPSDIYAFSNEIEKVVEAYKDEV